MLYLHLPEVILASQVERFANKGLGLWVITGEEAIRFVQEKKGNENDPLKCDPETWRRQIAEMVGGNHQINLQGQNGEEVISFNNYIHAPKRSEVERDLEVLQKFI